MASTFFHFLARGGAHYHGRGQRRWQKMTRTNREDPRKMATRKGGEEPYLKTGKPSRLSMLRGDFEFAGAAPGKPGVTQCAPKVTVAPNPRRPRTARLSALSRSARSRGTMVFSGRLGHDLERFFPLGQANGWPSLRCSSMPSWLLSHNRHGPTLWTYRRKFL